MPNFIHRKGFQKKRVYENLYYIPERNNLNSLYNVYLKNRFFNQHNMYEKLNLLNFGIFHFKMRKYNPELYK